MYDAIVVGARVAGATTAMLMARKQLRVLLVDKASFPSDTISTHYIHAAGIEKLNRWGLLRALEATSCPPVERVRFDFGTFALEGSPPPVHGVSTAYAPRRTILDKLLVDAAAQAGVEVRQRYSVQELVANGGKVTGIRGRSESGVISTERARIVIGADGMRSFVAKAVDAPAYNQKPAASCAYYSYWANVSVDRVEVYVRDRFTVLAFSSHFGLTCVVVFYAIADFPQVRMDIEGHHRRAVDATPLGERMRAGKREERFVGTADLPNFFRKPWGSGWALVGDAGYHKDPLTAQGITDAFLQAEWLADAIHEAYSGRAAIDETLATYERERNGHSMAMYELTYRRAMQTGVSPQMAALLRALEGNQEQIDRLVGVDAGTVSVDDFFSPENTGRIMRGRKTTACK